MAWTQENRQARIRLDLGADAVVLSRLTAHERLGEPFRIVVEVVSRAKQIDFLPHMGALTGVDIYGEDGAVVRHFHGHLTEATYVEMTDEGFIYELTLRPWLWLLSQRVDYRIFQDMSALDVVSKVFQDAGFNAFSSSVGASIPPREYCVQARESDLDFVSRLLEEEGIYYFFRHEAGQHTLVLCDNRGAHEQVSGGVLTFRPSDLAGRGPSEVHRWVERVASSSQTVSLRDYNFTTPTALLEGKAEGVGDYAGDAAEVFDYPGGNMAAGVGDPIAHRQREALQVRRRLVEGQTHLPTLACGGLFTLKNHEEDRFCVQHLVVEQTYDVSHQQYLGGVQSRKRTASPLEIAFVAAPADTPWRPLRTTHKPRARGPETAVVTGPSGEEIYTDEYGRVKVQFFWDRVGKKNEKSSCWMRVSMGWAGKARGEAFLPRVGDEVIVDFIDGDPDRPIVTGRVYNADRVVPLKLPAHRTVSGWRTQTVYGKSTSGYEGAVSPPTSEPGFNELAFEDRSGEELISVRAQRDMKVEVFRDEDRWIHRNQEEKIGLNATYTVQTGDESHIVDRGKRSTEIESDETLTIRSGDVKTTVKRGNVTTSVKMGDVTSTLDMGDEKRTLSLGDYSLKTELGSVTIEAMQQITLKVGQSSIVIDQLGVTVKGMMISTEAQLQWSAKGMMMQAEGSAMTMVKGGIVMIN